jgi:hypothetical protein
MGPTAEATEAREATARLAGNTAVTAGTQGKLAQDLILVLVATALAAANMYTIPWPTADRATLVVKENMLEASQIYSILVRMIMLLLLLAVVAEAVAEAEQLLDSVTVVVARVALVLVCLLAVVAEGVMVVEVAAQYYYDLAHH